MDKNHYILDDESLRELADGTPYAEGDPLDAFLEEGKEVARALEQVGGTSVDQRVQILAIMRGFYFLGVLRGGEAYRATLQAADEVNEPGTEPVEFPALSLALAEYFAQSFVEELQDLQEMEPKEWAQMCGLLHIPNRE